MSLIQTGRSLPSYGIAAVGAGIYLGRMSRNAGGDYVIGIRITAAAGIVEMHKGLQIQPDITRLDELVSGYEEGRFSLPRGALQSAVSLTERDYRGRAGSSRRSLQNKHPDDSNSSFKPFSSIF